MSELAKLIKGYRCDKGGRHSYLEAYEKIFSPIKQNVKNVLEIGIFDGGSIHMWSKYFEKAHIYGIDSAIWHEIPAFLSEYSNVTIHEADAYDMDFMHNNFSDIKFDIVIDDGSHIKKDMIFFAQEYSKLLIPGGLLFIEDIQDYGWVSDIIDAFPANIKKNMAMDFRKNKNRYDDILLMAESA